MKVIDRILENNCIEFHIDDVERVVAMRFAGVHNDSGFNRAVSRLCVQTRRLKKTVDLYAEHESGVHAYRVYLVNKEVLYIPVWSIFT